MSKKEMSEKVHRVLTYFKNNRRAQLLLAAVILIVIIVPLILIKSTKITGTVIRGSDTNASIITELDDVDNDPDANYVARHIDGVEVPFNTENLYPVVVMIENLATVRPQSGLQAANVVYEALAEGGITRFMAIYAGGEDIAEIGPVRSARRYYIDWAEEYRGLYAHAGGSPLSLSQLYGNEYLFDLNQINGSHLYFWRDSTKYAPHNLFTSAELLSYAIRDNKLQDKVGEYSVWRFEEQAKKKNRPTSEKNIKLDFSSQSYNVEYKYDRESNHYLRWNGDAEHFDALTSQQISVCNVLVQFVPISLLESDSGRLEMETTGEGKIILFNNGEAREGIWEKDTAGERTKFIINGKSADFIPGNTWIEILPDSGSIEYN